VLTLVAATILVAARSSFAERDWAEDKGEFVDEAASLQLGADVEAKAGPPAGPPLDGAALEARTKALASTMRCPVCQGLSVQDSPSESARNMKAQVRAMVAAGYDDAQILGYFESAYGEFIRMLPRAEGFNLLAWGLPGAGLLLGALVSVWVIRQSLAGVDQGAAAAPSAGSAARTSPPDADPWLQQVREEVEGRRD
jgi:cytochrome c-type biogenesis protein CcmH